jgi:3-hydroxy-3-methylglutaryl CoA synthase
MRWFVFMALMLAIVVAAEMTKEERDKQCKSTAGWGLAAMLLSGLAAPFVPEVTAFVWFTAASAGLSCK